jgi:hypothetical protein
MAGTFAKRRLKMLGISDKMTEGTVLILVS